jgi:hypothetical protein
MTATLIVESIFAPPEPTVLSVIVTVGADV